MELANSLNFLENNEKSKDQILVANSALDC